MKNSTIILTGWLGSDVRLNDAGDVQVASFRVGHTPRRFDKETGVWGDGPTEWYDVSAWRGLALNCAASLHRGDPVVIHGRVRASSWTRDGATFTSFDVQADFVGHDLNFGSSAFTKVSRRDETGGSLRPEVETSASAA